MAVEVGLGELWGAAGVLAGFQIAAFTWRITRELAMASKGERIWLPPADYLNLASLVVILFGVYAGVAADVVDLHSAVLLFGWAVVLLACWPFGVLGHYDLLGRDPRRTGGRPPATLQELIVICVAAVLSVGYWVLAS